MVGVGWTTTRRPPFRVNEHVNVNGTKYISLCGHAAHLHEEVLPEVMLGEFHTAARALEVIDLVEELYVSATSLLCLPVTQGRLAEVHTPYFSRARGISTGCRDMFSNNIYQSAIFGSALLDEKVWLGRSHEKNKNVQCTK